MKVVLIIVALLLGLAGLAMSLCGSVFTFSSLFGGIGMAGIAVPATGLGIVLMWAAWKVFKSTRSP